LRHVVLDRWSRGFSSVHRLDPRAKIVSLLLLLIALATARRSVPRFAFELALLLVAALFWARVPVLGALARAALVLPLAATFAAITWLGGDPARAISLVLKSYISALAVLFVVSTTPLPALLRGLEAMGAPRFLLEVTQFLYRYLFLISEEAQLMRAAAAARNASLSTWRGNRERFQAAAGALAVLFVRSYQRAALIHRAMLARGFEGRIPAMSASRFTVADITFVMLFSGIPWALRFIAASSWPRSSGFWLQSSNSWLLAFGVLASL
jgi:cobalt/nickel transport system permease protein